MKKDEFINELKRITAYLPQAESEKYIEYYREIIADAMEDGMSEEDAVYSLGSIAEIEGYIKENNELPSSQKFPSVKSYAPVKNIKKRHLPAWAIILIAVGFPVWFPLVCVFFVLYLVVWAIIASLYAAAASIFVCGITAIVASFFAGDFSIVMLTLGTGLFFIGISVFMLTGMIQLTKLYAELTVWIVKKCINGVKGVS